MRFSEIDSRDLEHLTDAEWKDLLTFCDASQATLLVGYLCRPFLPEWVRDRIDRNLSDNACRFERLKTAVLEISDGLQERGIDFTLLKGFAHSQAFAPDPRLRAQGDIDIWCQPDRVFDARDALFALQYRPIRKSKGRHLDPMIRETAWEWTGDYFAPDLPIPVDLHYQLWDQDMERISGPPEDEFWNRRCSALTDGRLIPMLHLADALGFAAMHLLMHLLHGDFRLQRSWELAYFLQKRSEDSEFWSDWQKLHSPGLRRLEVLIFVLTAQWFGCRIPGLIAGEAENLPKDLWLWINHYGFSPIEALFVPNKDELWLNLCLLQSFRDKARVLSRRLLPLPFTNLTRVADNGHGTPNSRGETRSIRPLLRRIWHHAYTLPFTCIRGLRWRYLYRRLSRQS
jgi:hypothetical protein